MALAREKWQIETLAVLDEVFAHRVEQERRYGGVNDRLENGTGPEVCWIPIGDDACNATATEIQKEFRVQYEALFDEKTRLPSWMHLVREEIAEAFQESDPTRLEEELIQVAALCVSWIERLHKKSSADN